MSDKLDIKTMYETFRALETYSDQSRWNRFNICLIVNSILLLSWARLFSIQPDRPNLILIAICLIGIVMGPIWSSIGTRSSQYQDSMHKGALAIEKTEEDFANNNIPKPYSRIEDTREKVEKGEFTFSSSKNMLNYIPKAFSVLFFILLLYSFS